MFQEFIDFFTQPSPVLWVSQICGLLGFFIITVSYQFKKSSFLLVSGISYILFALESGIAGLFSNAIVSAMSFVRNMVMLYFLTRKKREMPACGAIVIVAIIWIAEILLFAADSSVRGDWGNYLPPVLVTLYTFAANHKNYYVLKAGAFLLETGFLVFFLLNGLPFSVLRQAVLVLSVLVSVCRMAAKDIKQKREVTHAVNRT